MEIEDSEKSARKREVFVTVLEADQHEDDFPPKPLNDFTAWFESLLSKIPADFRDDAEIAFTSVSGSRLGHDYYSSVTVGYWRIETDRELDEREMDDARLREELEKNKRLQVEAFMLRHNLVFKDAVQ